MIKFRYKQIIKKIFIRCDLKIDDSTGRISPKVLNTFKPPSISDDDKRILLNQVKESCLSIYNDRTLGIMIDNYQYHPV